MNSNNSNKEHSEEATKEIRDIDSIHSMVENYKEHISKTQLKDEIYKWELLNEYSGRPNIKAEDFNQEIKDIKFDNLIYPMAMAVLSRLAKEKPKETRQLFIELYDESNDLTERVKAFNIKSLKLYKDIDGALSHHQDERSIATYLTFYYPDKYTFYKYSFYKKYCELMGVKLAKKNERYAHYLELIDDLIERYIAIDTDLIKQVKSYIPDYYDGTNHKLLAQDILFQMLDKKEETNYWVFQGNPKVFDFESALKQEVLTDWTVSAYKDKIQIGDKVILWITGSQSGCYALAEVTSEPHQKTSSPDDHLWKKDDKNDLKAGIKITHNLVDNPVLKSEVDTSKELESLKVGNQGTNFNASKEEYQAILNLIGNNSTFQKTRSKFDPTVFDNYIKFLRRINFELNIQANDKRTVYTSRNNNLNFTIGQRYCLNLRLSDPRGVYGVISKEKLLDSSESFGGKPPQPFYTFYNQFDPNAEEWDSIIEAIKDELNRTSKSGHRRHNNSDFENYVFQNTKATNETDDTMKLPLNTILYGPPGTGKTYNTVNIAVEIANPEFDLKQSRIEITKEFDRLMKDGQIVFTTFHQSMAYEDFIEGIKPLEPKTEGGQVIYKVIPGILKELSERIRNIEKLTRNNPEIIKSYSNFDEVYSAFVNKLKEIISELEEGENHSFESRRSRVKLVKIENDNSILTNGENAVSSETVTKDKLERIYNKFRSPDEITNIVKQLRELGSDIGWTTNYFAVFKALKEFESSIKQTDDKKQITKTRQNFVLIIDEINRGNVSSIFGELITLIEDDKREGNQNEMKVTLPYSKQHFSVPNNLYIIGTMNTADRSVEALDTALRRRFSFIEMNPEPMKLSSEEFKCNNIHLEALLEAMNARIEKLLDKDFRIGHSYFMNIKKRQEPLEEIKSIFQNKILPLLQEYFYGDWGKIRLVIGKDFVEIKNGTIKFLSTDSYEDFEEYDEKPIYNFTNPAGWTIDSFKSIYE